MITLHDFTYRDQENRKQVIKILYQDENLIVVDKPAGLRVIPDHWSPDLPNLRDLLNLQYAKQTGIEKLYVWVAHRIDSETSGLVLFARNAKSHRILNDRFENNRIIKKYKAIVKGCPSPPKGQIELPIDSRRRKSGQVHIAMNGKPSDTEYRLLEKFRRFSLLEVMPHTGRTHQIRIHLSAIGTPLAVDSLYGGENRITISQIKRGLRIPYYEDESALISRLSLHAWKLNFGYPQQEKRMDFTSDWPKDLQALYKALKKWNRE